MAEKSKLYIDEDGVKRGYYVYVHMDTSAESVFYVGKGYGDRAWKITGRNQLWQQYVESLEDGWRAEIVQDDLSEIEAFQLEAELVEKYGGPAARGGSLKNWIPGGEEPASITLEVPMPESMANYFAAYANAREFKSLSSQEKKQLAELMLQELGALEYEAAELSSEAEAESNDSLIESLWTVDSLLMALSDNCRELKHRRIGWHDFCLDFEENLEQLEFEMEDTNELHPRAIELLKLGASIGRKTLAQFDSGNKAEAERIAKEASAES